MIDGGLRERKKQRTRDAISAAAIALFLARGYDRVSVAEVAAAAEVSKPTLFKYFASKEDLALHRAADHAGEPARVVLARPAGVPPLGALHAHFRAGLDARDPVTGLNDHPEVLAYHRMVFETPALAARVAAHAAGDEESLAAALAGSDTPGSPDLVAAGQVVAVRRILARENWRHLAAGESADVRHPGAVTAAADAFALLADGLSRRYG
ncbi:TetR/AcrR family transcriptional regulator [Catenuloplanes indicus]|uniref:AcrR family transcriptional regulator n=1 Tax=Catenuloplanes indicus TaxID=137267 RepID=A0AAE4AX46_9ACTN|nr:TetR/AcrR family transcriptional regulator [Catenuloplanes indicus]MDQ0366630.1 AcrR family transcriptional regulator [Catenuloplanes indicus]